MKRTMKLISATAMLIFNLFVCFASVFAWFYANKNPEANDIGMMIDANELTLAFELYKYDIEINKLLVSIVSTLMNTIYITFPPRMVEETMTIQPLF